MGYKLILSGAEYPDAEYPDHESNDDIDISGLASGEYVVKLRSNTFNGEGPAPLLEDEAMLYVVKVDLILNTPDNPCLIGSGIDYECNIEHASITVDNYDWSYMLNCKTVSTDPYECPEASGHNTEGVGPVGSSEDKWVSNIFGSPYWSHAGEHEVKCKVTVGGVDFTAKQRYPVCRIGQKIN